MLIGYLGSLAGYTYVYEVMADPLFRQAVANLMDEVTPGASHFCSPPLKIGVRSQESGARRKEEEGRSQKKCFYKYEMLPVTPTLQPVPGIDLDEYKKTLIERFSNPKIRDRLPRLCLNGSAKIPKFVLGSLRDKLQLGGAIDYLSLIIAAWCQYLNGYDDQNRSIPIDDPLADRGASHICKNTSSGSFLLPSSSFLLAPDSWLLTPIFSGGLQK
jgi:mannitol 2-dehydrogenase